MAQPSQFIKDPDAVLDWRFNWSQWLEDAETITSHEILVEDDSEAPVSVVSSDHVEGAVVVFLSGGTARNTAEVTCRISTDQNRTDDRTIRIRVRER